MNNDKTDLFTSISSGNVNNSLLLSTKYILLNDSLDIFENILIDIASYIGTFINLYDISKLLDIFTSIKKFIENEKIIIKDVYILITKMCIVCDIYNKNSISRCGTMSMKTLKEKISFIFSREDMKLSSNGIIRFDGVLPPHDDENYRIALKIITILIKTIKSSDDIPIENADRLNDIAIKLKNIFDFIFRSKYKFETKFYSQDNDNVWFIWGVLSILYKEQFIDSAFWLFNYNFKKSYRKKRLGIILSMGCAVIFSHKKDISNGWNDKEVNVINKIDDISLKLYNEIRNKIAKEYPEVFKSDRKSSEKDGLDLILEYVPLISSHNTNCDKNKKPELIETKSIIY